MFTKDSAQLLDAVRRVEKEMADKGYDASITVIPIYFISYNIGGTDNNRNIMTTQLLGENNDYQTFDEGQAPVLANEIAFSVPVMEASGWKIGDTVTAVIGGNRTSFQ